MLRVSLALSLALSIPLLLPAQAQAHCQVPCGIYDDHNRVHRMREDLATITKAIKQIRALSKKKDAKSRNQLVRWVVTKEQHAEKIIRVISDYFMAQKIKPKAKKGPRAKYMEKLARHHGVMVAAMKCKQSADPKAAQVLGEAIAGIEAYWPAK